MWLRDYSWRFYHHSSIRRPNWLSPHRSVVVIEIIGIGSAPGGFRCRSLFGVCVLKNVLCLFVGLLIVLEKLKKFLNQLILGFFGLDRFVCLGFLLELHQGFDDNVNVFQISSFHVLKKFLQFLGETLVDWESDGLFQVLVELLGQLRVGCHQQL